MLTIRTASPRSAQRSESGRRWSRRGGSTRFRCDRFFHAICFAYDRTMSLDTYRRRRDFRLTPEPVAREVTSDPWSLAFAVHLRGGWPRPRFELRLEHEGVLLTWTLPRGPSPDPGAARRPPR